MSSDASREFGSWLNDEFSPDPTPDGGVPPTLLDEPPAPVAPPKPTDAQQSVVPATHELTPAQDTRGPDRESAARTADTETGRSSVKITVNAKGHRQWEVKVYADDGETPEAAAERAVQIEKRLESTYGLPGGKA